MTRRRRHMQEYEPDPITNPWDNMGWAGHRHGTPRVEVPPEKRNEVERLDYFLGGIVDRWPILMPVGVIAGVILLTLLLNAIGVSGPVCDWTQTGTAQCQ